MSMWSYKTVFVAEITSFLYSSCAMFGINCFQLNNIALNAEHTNGGICR